MTSTPAERSALEQAGAVTTPTSLTLDDPAVLSWDDYERLAGLLGTMQKALPWWIGDLLNYAEDVFGEESYQLDGVLGLRPQTLANYKSIAKHIPENRRRRALSPSTHAEVAYLPPKEREHWLSMAEKHGWRREQLREARHAARELEGPVDKSVETSSALTRLGELVPGSSHTCPACGHVFNE